MVARAASGALFAGLLLLSGCKRSWSVKVEAPDAPDHASALLQRQLTSALTRQTCDVSDQVSFGIVITDTRTTAVGARGGVNDCFVGVLKRTRFHGQSGISATVFAERR